jgi:TRAP-type C4-dicarboxylate transport system permease small subunit
VFVAVLVRYAWAQAAQQIAKGDTSMTLAIPIAWYWAPLLVGLAISALACVVHAVRHFQTALGGTDPLGGLRGDVADGA